MSSVVYCKPIAKGIHAFYLNVGETTYYLFSQNYRRGVNKYFSNGVRLDKAVCFSSAKGDTALMRTMEKIPMYIRYIERTYDVVVLRKTAKKKTSRNARFA